MANPYRGELSVHLMGQDYILKLSFDQIVRLEEEMGKGILCLAKDFAENNFGVYDVVTLLQMAIPHEARLHLTKEKLGYFILEEGLAYYASICIKLLSVTIEGKNIHPKKSSLPSL